jgi:aspartyl-tRNA(Asn)/glutamyl-tRNA(Gln) amidotransferase subunit C
MKMHTLTARPTAHCRQLTAQSSSLTAFFYICSMQVDDALIDKLSRLAMLEFDAAGREEIKADLEKMIGFVDKLRELDTAGVEPLLHMAGEVNVLRDDVPGGMLTQAEALQNAPLHNDAFFLVPKVIKKDEA